MRLGGSFVCLLTGAIYPALDIVFFFFNNDVVGVLWGLSAGMLLLAVRRLVVFGWFVGWLVDWLVSWLTDESVDVGLGLVESVCVFSPGRGGGRGGEVWPGFRRPRRKRTRKTTTSLTPNI